MDSERIQKLREYRDLQERLGDIDKAARAQMEIDGLLKQDTSSQTSARPQGGGNPFEHVPYGGYGGGLVTMGAGFDRLLTGGKELATKVGGRVAPPYMVEEKLGEIDRDYKARREAYAPLKEELGGVATLGEIIGETAPFMGVPVPQITRAGAAAAGGVLGRLAERPLTGLPLRNAPEVAVGGTEAAIPYDPETDRTQSFMEGGASAAVTNRIVNAMSRRANAKRGIFEDPEVQSLHNTGQEMGILVRRGSLEDQIASAESYTANMASARMPGEIGEDIVEGARTGLSQVAGDFETSYNMLFGAMDRHGADTSALTPKLRSMLAQEQARGSHSSDKLMQEIDRWINTPSEGLTIEKLHQFRHALRTRMDALDPAEIARKDSYGELERAISDHIFLQADSISPGYGEALRNLDRWYYEDLARLRRAPGVQAALGENPSPTQVANWFTSSPTPFKKQLFDSMSDTGKEAVLETAWNNAYQAGMRGRQFNPLSYAKYIESSAESMKAYMSPTDYQAYINTGKVMRHIAGEGRTADNSLLRMIRGFPFMYRAVGDAIRRSNWRWALSQAPADIRPGSPEMETFYRGLIRSLAIQDGGDLSEGFGDTFGQVREEATQAPLRMEFWQ